MVELVDTLDLGSSAERCVGSNPIIPTKIIDDKMIIKRQKNYSGREKVPQAIEEKAKRSGVIQKDSSGTWRIISLKTSPAEYWDAHYDTKEDAEKALSAYHARKH